MYRSIVRQVAKRSAHVCTNYWKIPAASIMIQNIFRRYRVRIRFPDYKRRVLAQRKRRLERSRYLNALELVYVGREAERLRQAQIERRQYARKPRNQEGFEDNRGGWKPNYEATDDVDFWTHIWKPPQGSQFGVRNLKVKIPPSTHLEAKIAKEDYNAWIGVPVMMEPVKHDEGKLGPPKREFFNTMKGFEHVKTTIPRPQKKSEIVARGDDDAHFKIRYNWLPGHMVKSSILDQMVLDLQNK